MKKITNATVEINAYGYKGQMCDAITITFDFKDPLKNEFFQIKFEAPSNTGKDYVERNFRVVPDIIA